jgi:branched-chain amino acid transport system permease protein
MAITLKERTPAHRAYQAVGLAVGAVVLFMLPWWLEPFRLGQVSKSISYVVAIMGLVILVGMSGQISLGHSAFFGLGGYTTAILVQDHGWPFLATFPVSMALCFVVGFLVGLPALRIRGLYLAVITLALAVTFPTLITKFDDLTGGPNGLNVQPRLEPPSWTNLARNERHIWTYFLILGIAALAFILARNLTNSRVGRAIIAIRDRQTAAATNGVNLALYKTCIFGMSALFAGVGGSLFVMETRFISTTDVGLNLAIFLIVGLVVGGVGSMWGAIPGGLVVVFVPYWSASWVEAAGGRDLAYYLLQPGVVFGVGLIVLMFVLQGGLIDALKRLRALVLRVEPNPSWLSDAAAAADARRRSQSSTPATELIDHPVG